MTCDPRIPVTPLPSGRREAYGPQTWALIREAYLGGTPAPHLSRTFGPHVDTIRKRAVREKWTRTAYAAAQERARVWPAPDPQEPEPAGLDPSALLDAALAQARAHFAAGRDAQADAAIRRGDALARLAEVAERLRPRTLDALFAARHEIARKLEQLADDAARRALNDPNGAPKAMCEWAYRWRAENLGPACAAHDAQVRRNFGHPDPDRYVAASGGSPADQAARGRT